MLGGLAGDDEPRRDPASTASTTWFCRPTTASSASPSELGIGRDRFRFQRTGVRLLPATAQLTSMSTLTELADLPGPARRRPRAARRVRRALPGQAPVRRPRAGPAGGVAAQDLRRPALGATSGGRCSTRSSTAATTTCPRPTCGRACAACPARATARPARSWARSTAATRSSSIALAAAIRAGGGADPHLDRRSRASSPSRGSARRRRHDGGPARPHDTVVIDPAAGRTPSRCCSRRAEARASGPTRCATSASSAS